MPSSLIRLSTLIACAICMMETPSSAASPPDESRRAEPPVAVLSIQSNDSRNRTVRVHNQTGWTMTALNASSGGAWTGNLLGGAALTPGRSARVSIDDGSGACRYALRAQFDNGETLERDGVDSCQIADYYLAR